MLDEALVAQVLRLGIFRLGHRDIDDLLFGARMGSQEGLERIEVRHAFLRRARVDHIADQRENLFMILVQHMADVALALHAQVRLDALDH